MSTLRGPAVVRSLLPALAVLLISCSSPASSGSDNSAQGSEQASTTASSAAGSSQDSGSGGNNGGGNGGGSGNVGDVAKALVPPNSHEVTSTTAADTSFIVYESSDSIDSLKSFYEDAIPKIGMRIFSTTQASGGVAYVMATDESASFGGAVSIYPSDTGSGATVSVTVSKTN
jgi:hypothetical protein